MKRSMITVAALLTIVLTASACGTSQTASPKESSAPAADAKLLGEIKIDGSSTVFPITEAMAEGFQALHPGVRVVVGISGSSGGFKKWVKGETDINNSSRKIKPSEVEEAKNAGFEALEIPVAYDGLSVVVSNENTWLKCITQTELKQIWDKGSTVTRWNQVNPAWPNEEIRLYGPGTDSGTFEYFTEHINGKAGQSRADYTASEDDNVLVRGVSGSKNAIGYFGYAYYVENRDRIRAVAVDGGTGCVEPTDESIGNLSYPIARLIYIYPSTRAMERPEVSEFVRFYLQNGPELVRQVGYTPLPLGLYSELLAKIKQA